MSQTHKHTLCMSQASLHTPRSTFHTPHSPHSTLQTSQCTLHSPHAALHTLHSLRSTLQTPLQSFHSVPTPRSPVFQSLASGLQSLVSTLHAFHALHTLRHSTCIRTFDIHTCIHLHPCMHTYRRARAHMQLQCVALIYITYIHYFACCSVPDYLQYLLCDKAVQAGALHVGAQFFPASFATKP